MIDHAAARDAISTAFRAEVGREPTRSELQAIQAVAAGESQYGRGWNDKDNACPGGNSNNWGAVQTRHRPPCPPGTFETGDTHPGAGGSTPYRACFRCYASPADGAAHVVRLIMTSPRAVAAGTPGAAGSSDVERFSRAMYRQGYYEGVGATSEDRVRWHVGIIDRWVGIISDSLDEPRALFVGGAPSKSVPWIALALAAGVIWSSR